MGNCIANGTFGYDEEDVIIEKLKRKREAKELQYFREQLKKETKQHSELDLNGKGTSRKNKHIR